MINFNTSMLNFIIIKFIELEKAKQLASDLQHEVDGMFSQLTHIESLVDIGEDETLGEAIERIVKENKYKRSKHLKRFKVTGEPEGWSYTETIAEDLSEAHAVEAMKGAFAAGYRRVKIIEQIEEEPK